MTLYFHSELIFNNNTLEIYSKINFNFILKLILKKII